MKLKFFYLLIWFNGNWRSMDNFYRHTEDEAKNLMKQWKRSGFKAKMEQACTVHLKIA